MPNSTIVDFTDEEKKGIFLMAHSFARMFTFDGKSTASSKRGKFKPKLARDYLQIPEKSFGSRLDIRCQILDTDLPKFLVIGSHLFKHGWGSVMAHTILGIENIDSTRNGLLLFQPIEKAFDRSQLCFLKSPNDDSFYLKLLDPRIRNISLLDQCLPFISVKECINYGKSIEEVISLLKKCLTFEDRLITFGDLEGREIKCYGITRPYKRCLNFHASRARDYAIEQKWISKEVVFDFTWSQEFKSDAINSYLNNLGSFDKIEEDDINLSDSVDD